MANRFYVQPANPLEALMLGEQSYTAGRDQVSKDRMTEARRQAGELAASGDYKGALGASFRGGDIQGANVLAALMEKQLGRSADAGQVFGTPIYGKTADGKEGIGTFDKQGNFRLIDTRGFTPSPGVKTLDLGTGYGVLNARSGELMSSQPRTAPGTQMQGPTGQGQVTSPMTSPTPVAQQGFIPKDVAGEARQKKVGAEEGTKLATFGKAKSALDSGVASLDDFEKTASQLLKHPGLPAITGLQGAFPNIPGNASANAQAIYDKLIAKGGFAELQKMRDASPTGGALGSVTEAEHTLLRNAFAALAQTQGTPQFKEELAKVVNMIRESKLRLHGAFKQDFERLKSGEQSAPRVVPFSDYFRQQ